MSKEATSKLDPNIHYIHATSIFQTIRDVVHNSYAYKMTLTGQNWELFMAYPFWCKVLSAQNHLRSNRKILQFCL